MDTTDGRLVALEHDLAGYKEVATMRQNLHEKANDESIGRIDGYLQSLDKKMTGLSTEVSEALKETRHKLGNQMMIVQAEIRSVEKRMDALQTWILRGIIAVLVALLIYAVTSWGPLAS